MKIRNGIKYAVTVFMAGVLFVGCNNGASQSGFAPTGAMQQGQNALQSAPNPDVQKSVTHYYVVKLGTLGGKFSEANTVNNRGWVTGWSTLRGNKVIHAALWRRRHKTDLGTLGGPNSAVNGFDHNSRGVISGVSETSQTDPYGENWCETGLSYICLGFRWQNGVMTPLKTLGGNNSVALDVNNHGQVIGQAETGTQDQKCQAPQVFDYYAVIWEPNSSMVTLPPYAGDVVSSVGSINENGQVVGASGPCYFPGPQAQAHAVIWQNGTAIDLGNLGGSEGNAANDINSSGQIIGGSDLPGDQAQHAFLWQNGTGMKDLGTLPGDTFSYAFGINDKGQIVGQSCPASGACRGFIWQNGRMTDLNLLVPPNPKVDLVYGGDINNSGQIVSAAYDAKTGSVVAVLLIPGKKALVRTDSYVPKVTLPENMRMQLKRTWGMGLPFEKP
jgi:probable HAF family extracellular repeat protein